MSLIDEPHRSPCQSLTRGYRCHHPVMPLRPVPVMPVISAYLVCLTLSLRGIPLSAPRHAAVAYPPFHM